MHAVWHPALGLKPPAQTALHAAALHGGQALEEGPTGVSLWGACRDRMQGAPRGLRG